MKGTIIKLYSFSATIVLLSLNIKNTSAAILKVGKGQVYKHIKEAVTQSKNGDTIIVFNGLYKEGNIIIDKSIYLLGEGFPVLDGEIRYEIFSVKSSNVTIKGFQLQNSGRTVMEDPGAIKVYECSNILIEGNIFINNYFGVYLQYTQNCIIKNNVIKASQKEEYQSGNGIHCWKSDSLQITGNRISGHRDGIYFEFVTHSVIWRNVSKNNLRYGLHFMFSNDNAYITNYFKNNGAGVAVMFTKKVVMMNNTFEENWGDASYGVLFKELSDCYLSGNKFLNNTTGILFDGSNRIRVEYNLFSGNGWGMRLQANCMENVIAFNNFMGNIFDVATNGTLTLNHFTENYWDKYEGYDLNKDKFGDVPFHPLSLYSVIVEKNPPAMLLYQSFIVNLLDKSEKVIPSLTPENFVDNKPSIFPYPL
ncbi:MAG: nitrous oxide reductase family maturation protein NosD [Chitinophagaceae bacterium]|jgi:nitrous oxidase accessory protein|nr:nitrous oxide reductase family maturation protein NosD [Chitinophagaceae bacterium]MBP6987475.1 nitrous oxide reductase family maturation protein NosD [Ferruginibacter sp.]NMD29572.1 nitrous oxide reductase family maturation protein NosD [Bacteroidota bacterium]MBK7089443.1 nitrous oxide reductase family maturation protein NosD [Chitinophagaceae bacterium]MBK8928940.1 nitrous oxide reductase family maturation protein NosD [Chitinophagaceae bacterium]